MKNIDRTVFSDNKWPESILNHLIINTIKYRNNKATQINIKVVVIKNGIRLIIEDNRVGITADEIDWIFKKGITRNNGRINGKSIVMGYIYAINYVTN